MSHPQPPWARTSSLGRLPRRTPPYAWRSCASRRNVTFAMTAIVVAALLGGCGVSTSGSKTAAAELRVRQDALVSFFNAFITDLPIRASARKAAIRFRSDLEMHPSDLGAAEQALKESLSGTESWHRLTESLPATSADITPTRTDYSDAAADEVKALRDQLAVTHAIATGGPRNSELLRRADALTAKAESLEVDAKKRLAAVLGQLGGEAFLRHRIGVKRLQEAAQNGLQEKAVAASSPR
jgi:hypothetical protein